MGTRKKIPHRRREHVHRFRKGLVVLARDGLAVNLDQHVFFIDFLAKAT
jgi:hypothetical protein